MRREELPGGVSGRSDDGNAGRSSHCIHFRYLEIEQYLNAQLLTEQSETGS